MPPIALYAFSDANPWAPVLAIPLFTVFPWYPTLIGFAWLMGEVMGSWQWIEMDAAIGRIRARQDARFLWGSRTVSIPPEAITGLSITHRKEGTSSRSGRTRIEVRHEGRKWLVLSGETSTHLSFNQGAHAERERLIQFVFRLARRLGWAGYRVDRAGPVETTVTIEEMPGEGVEPFPDPDSGPEPTGQPARPPPPVGRSP